jgi:hypothetical protein
MGRKEGHKAEAEAFLGGHVNLGFLEQLELQHA